MRGLPTLARARQERRWKNQSLWNWLIPLVGVVLLIWWRVDALRTAELREGLLARQRDIAGRLGPKWLPLREKVERWTAECAVPSFTEVPNPALIKTWDFRDKPGIYLRLAKKNAASPETIRKAATLSLHDGFTSCLVTSSNPNPVAGARCENTQDCASGELCNEFDQCAAPSQPYNLRIAYRATQVLSDEWLTSIQSARGELQLRGAVVSFDAIEKFDLPIATELLSKATYFMVVVDEPVEGGEVPEPARDGDAAGEDRSIPDGPHWARICLWRVENDEKVFAIRREASGELRGARPQTEATRLARQRQANSCGLALEVRQALGAAGSH
ncbi:MAG: hypothetical protein FJ096_07205 [Deltaproteobacteria bacterium]|nr:hypothetical protein [Deltaproteobacteria bacterium]